MLRNAITTAGEHGIVFCASAGNTGMNNDQFPHYPSSYDSPNIIAVAATNGLDRRAGFSSWGRVSVDLGAPGTDILSSVSEGRYESMSGTSMATPFVTGTVALCAALYPDESVAQRVQRILSSVGPEPALARRCTAAGRLDVAAALRGGPPTDDLTPPVTTALGAGQAPSPIPVAVRLFAVDEQDGSGVASTSWRLDGGKWSRGARAIVPARRHARVTHTVEFYSVDRAGNVEATQSCSVASDTTGPRFDRFPVPKLPESPVTGGIDDADFPLTAYRLTLHRGETFRVAVTAPLGDDIALALCRWQKAALGPRLAGRAQGSARPLVYRASKTATYCLLLFSGENTRHPFTLAWDVQPRGVDIIPPSIAVSGDSEMWHNSPVVLRFVGDDGPVGSEVASIEVSLDKGLSWSPGSEVTVDAPADHSNDGLHWVRGRATDNAGNVSAARWSLVGIDTLGPATQAWGPARPVKRGRPIDVTFTVSDASGGAWCELVVRSATSGRVVAHRRLGWRPTPESGFMDDDERFACRLTRGLPRGAYDMLIAGRTHDEAGNRVTSAVCKRQLVVK